MLRSLKLNDLPSPPADKFGWPWIEVSPQLYEMTPADSAWPRISIITPSYNQGRFIQETIRSVLLQGYPNLEYIIMDGGSTDDSVEIIKKYEPWLTYWVSESDHGQSHAINKGILQSTGEILAWLNSDDTYLPGALYGVAQAFQQHPDAGLIYAHCQVVNEEGDFLHITGEPFDLQRMLLDYYTPIPQPSAFFLRQMTEKAGLLDESLHYVMDRDYWYRLGLVGEIVFAHDTWAVFRQYAMAKTSQISLARIAEISRVNESFFLHQKLPKHLAALRRKSMGNIYLKCARRAFKGGYRTLTWQYLQKAAVSSPSMLYSWRWLLPTARLLLK